jgi:hypothetical protein
MKEKKKYLRDVGTRASRKIAQVIYQVNLSYLLYTQNDSSYLPSLYILSSLKLDSYN